MVETGKGIGSVRWGSRLTREWRAGGVYELLTGSTQGEGKGKVTTVWSIGIFMYVIILKWKGQRHPSQCYVDSFEIGLLTKMT